MKHPGPLGAPCAGCGQYLTMRSAQQRAAAHRHRNACPAYQRYVTERRAS
ncbi:hypothetical protein SEA_FRANSOYER_96 [Microbacterium phage Fransoyer]|nr:hypothetical protein SEA_RUBYRALPH_96 [Microbacterium phage RubyRalph]UUG69661.1 hypothetical protein SEA_FRANSOYER_96 [Microbacterium phage Fransoyer]